MTLWLRIAELAKKLLGESAARPVDLSRIALDLASRSPDTATPPPEIEPPKPDAEIEVVPEYEFVVGAIREGTPVTFVTGRAGTGKSTLIRHIVSTVRGCVVVSPTGTAAINVGGVTIHSFFGFPPRVMNRGDTRDPKHESADVIRALGALIVDEVSMVTPDLIDAIDAAMRRTRKDPRPFGGVPVVLVGDLLQLPPVVADPEVARFYSHRYPSPYFFSADVFREVPIVAVELTRVFRQADADFVDLLDRIRTNRDHRDAVARLNRESWRDVGGDVSGATWLVPTNAAAAALNAERLEQLRSPESTFDAVIEGKIAASADRFPAPVRLALRPGARVMFVKNRKPWWVNGTTGTVIRIESDRILVELTPTGNVVEVERETWEQIEYRYDPGEKRIAAAVVGTFEQFPVTLGWAITIHKSQGMTLDAVRIDLGDGAFAPGQAYVALSRSRSIQGIRLDRPISMRDVVADRTILEFYRRVAPIRRGAGDLSKAVSTQESDACPDVGTAEPSRPRIDREIVSDSSGPLPIDPRIAEILAPAYEPCGGFSGTCRDMRWEPAHGHVPRGFLGATGTLDEVELVLLFDAPGRPRTGERHTGLASTYRYAMSGFQDGASEFHTNVRTLLDLCWPGEPFERQLRRVWMTQSLLCSPRQRDEASTVAAAGECAQRYLVPQAKLFSGCVVATLGALAARRAKAAGLVDTIAAASPAPPASQRAGARESWERVAVAVAARRKRTSVVSRQDGPP